MFRAKKHTLGSLLDDKSLILWATAAFFLIVISSTSLKLYFENPTDDKITQCIFSSPGILMYVLMAIITILGFTITLHRLHEENVRITNYPRLLDQVTKMLTTAKKKNVPVGFLGNTPVLGSMTLKKDIPQIYNQFFEALKGLRDNKDKDGDTLFKPLLCLDWAFDDDRTKKFNMEKSEKNAEALLKAGKDLGEFYMTFADYNKRSFVDCAEGFLDSTEFLEGFKRYKTHPVKTTRHNLPEYHLFVSGGEQNAIVVVPLDLPSTDSPNTVVDHYKVSMVGQKISGADNILPVLSTFNSYCCKLAKKIK